MLGLFIIATAVGLLGSLLAVLQSVGGLGSGVTVPLADYRKVQDDQAALKTEKERLDKELQELRQNLAAYTGKSTSDNIVLTSEEYRKLNAKSPVVLIPEQGNMHFKTGSAVLSDEFRAALEANIFPDLDRNLQAFGDRVNTLVIVGHTDTQPIRSGHGNLDDNLLPVLHQQKAVSLLVPGSNADLGLMRAASVREVLAPMIQKEHPNIKVQCLPAADGMASDGDIAPLPTEGSKLDRSRDDEKRRRIEILVLGLQAENKPPL